MVGFQPISDEERRQLVNALRGNAAEGTTLLMDRETTFSGTGSVEEDAEVIGAIKSVPTHY